MRALGITAAGGPEVLAVVECDVPEARPGQVCIRVLRAAINPVDTGMRSGGADESVQGGPPWVPGMDAAGVVVSAPSDDDLAVGDRVMAITSPFGKRPGAQAEYLVVPRQSVVHIPEGMSFDDASTLPMNAMTAHYALAELDLPAGATLAVSGGAGYLASYAISMARHREIRVIADTAPADEELVRGYGADTVIPRSDHFDARLREVCPEGVDAVLDAAALGAPVLGAIRNGGHLISVRPVDITPERDIRIQSILVAHYAKNQKALSEVAELAAQGVLKPRVAAVYELENAGEAHRLFDAGGVRGRFVLKLGGTT